MSVVVLKVGGASTGGVAEAVADLRAAGNQVCVVHGAGPQISEEMERRGLELRFVGGRRVTTREVLEVVCESFAEVNAAVCAAIGPDAVGLFGDEIGLGAEHVPELGLVGRAVPSAPRTVLAVLVSGRVPVVSPMAPGPLNVNADEAAAALALGIGAERLVFLTDVDGLILDGEVVDAIDVRAALALLDGGLLEGGIIPKLRAATTAARDGVPASIGRTAVTA